MCETIFFISHIDIISKLVKVERTKISCLVSIFCTFEANLYLILNDENRCVVRIAMGRRRKRQSC
jgi:hypothetical protein